MISQLGILFMKAIAPLPLAWVRGMGWALGWVLFLAVFPRRRIVRRNLELCFPQLSQGERASLTRQVFVRFAQAWLDRSWLWHGDAAVTRARLNVTGALDEFEGETPTVIFAPHFVGMDAGWSGVTQQVPRRFVGIYTQQSNPVLDAWMLRGRHRFGQSRPFGRAEGVHAIAGALRRGEVMYLLPDMNFGPEESIFVPFYGVPAATVPSLSRFARLGRAKVVPVVTRMTSAGYDVQVMPAWPGFPSGDVAADTAAMNERLQGYIDTMPDQYYWVHKRFKTRPPGGAPMY